MTQAALGFARAGGSAPNQPMDSWIPYLIHTQFSKIPHIWQPSFLS
jgi:hypothetical protein